MSTRRSSAREQPPCSGLSSLRRQGSTSRSTTIIINRSGIWSPKPVWRPVKKPYVWTRRTSPINLCAHAETLISLMADGELR